MDNLEYLIKWDRIKSNVNLVFTLLLLASALSFVWLPWEVGVTSGIGTLMLSMIFDQWWKHRLVKSPRKTQNPEPPTDEEWLSFVNQTWRMMKEK